MTNPGRRSPLTGQFRVDFVDMAPSSDGSLPAEFGVVEHDISLDWLEDPRLPAFLRWFADMIEADQRPEPEVELPEPWDDLRNAEAGTLDKRQAMERQLQRASMKRLRFLCLMWPISTLFLWMGCFH